MKIKSFNDIRFAKLKYKHEADIHDQALNNSFYRCKSSVKEAIKNPLSNISQEFVSSMVIKLIRNVK